MELKKIPVESREMKLFCTFFSVGVTLVAAAAVIEFILCGIGAPQARRTNVAVLRETEALEWFAGYPFTGSIGILFRVRHT